jgi:hypothetical protein
MNAVNAKRGVRLDLLDVRIPTIVSTDERYWTLVQQVQWQCPTEYRAGDRGRVQHAGDARQLQQVRSVSIYDHGRARYERYYGW